MVKLLLWGFPLYTIFTIYAFMSLCIPIGPIVFLCLGWPIYLMIWAGIVNHKTGLGDNAGRAYFFIWW